MTAWLLIISRSADRVVVYYYYKQQQDSKRAIYLAEGIQSAVVGVAIPAVGSRLVKVEVIQLKQL